MEIVKARLGGTKHDCVVYTRFKVIDIPLGCWLLVVDADCMMANGPASVGLWDWCGESLLPVMRYSLYIPVTCFTERDASAPQD